MIRMNTAEFAVRFAVGSRKKRVVGIVRRLAHRSFISVVAARFGTHSTRAENVRDAIINGVGRPVCLVIEIRFTKIGIPMKNKIYR